MLKITIERKVLRASQWDYSVVKVQPQPLVRFEAQGGQPFTVASALHRLPFLPCIRLVDHVGVELLTVCTLP